MDLLLTPLIRHKNLRNKGISNPLDVEEIAKHRQAFLSHRLDILRPIDTLAYLQKHY